MGCITRNALGKHDFAPMPAHLAEAQLDALLSHLSFDNETLFSMIEDRLSELHQIARTGEKSFAPDPRVAETRAALFTIRDAPPEILAPLKDHLAALEAADGARRLSHRQPVIDFRRAVDELKEWKRLWGDSDIAARNELLKAGGLRVVIGRPDGRTRGAAEILSVSASHPGFTLALAVALSKWTVAIELPTGHERRNAISFFGLEGHWGQVLAEMPDPDLTLMVPSPLRKRPTKTAPIVAFPPVSSTEPTVSVREAAGMIGIKPVTGYVWVSLGWLPMIRVNGVMRIPVSAIEPAAVAHPRFRRKAA
jgi:hypothetical protein